MAFVDLSHDVYDGMPGFKLKGEHGETIQYTAHVKPFFTHAQSRPKYQGLAEFEITELSMQTSIGTYLDSPYHRFADGRDISQLRLDEVILDGVCVDARGFDAWQPFPVERLPDWDWRGKAVLFCFGWDQFWGQEAYFAYPFVSMPVLKHLMAQGVTLIGVDTVNLDDSRDLSRPAHTLLLRQDILIVENLTNLANLLNQSFRFFAMPIKVRRGAAMNIRAFAECHP
jgi:kynurenine formamidase